jgi:hypothetical protein
MSADLRHMREAGPIGDSAAGVAGKARSAEELEAADGTAEELGSPAKTALASRFTQCFWNDLQPMSGMLNCLLLCFLRESLPHALPSP